MNFGVGFVVMPFFFGTNAFYYYLIKTQTILQKILDLHKLCLRSVMASVLISPHLKGNLGLNYAKPDHILPS